MNKTILGNLSTAVSLGCALTVTALVVRRELFPPGAATAAVSVETRTVADWRSYVQGARIGPADAKVTIVEFGDFECPFCRTVAERLRAIRGRYPHDVALVYRHYPLPYHRNALTAATASICAARQGRFAEYHDALFAHQDSLGVIAWERLATAAGVPDAAAFRACMDAPAVSAQIARDREAGVRLGVQGTPTLLVNERMLSAAPPGALETLVARAVRGG